jgi:hypothetical protein
MTMGNNVIDRFRFPDAAGYSQYWRRNKSPVETYELAGLLLGLRKVASLVGRNIGTLVWSGMKAENGLVIDPAMVMGDYPVPAAKTDRATGVVVRLSYAKIEWSQRVKEMALSTRQGMHPRHAAQFEFYLDICERVYLDNLSNRNPLGLYTEAQRLWAIEKAFDGASHPPTISELMNLWWEIAAEPNGRRYEEEFVDRSVRSTFKRTNLEKFYREPMAILNSIVDPLINKCPRISGVTERGDYRLDLYLSVWPRLFEFIRFWPIDSKDIHLLTRTVNKNILDFEDEEREKERGPSLVIPELIEKTALRTIPVFTENVRQIVENKNEVVSIQGSDIVMPAPNRIDRKTLHHLSIILRMAADRSALISRGLKTGKIDRRRLYRAETVGTIFKLTKTDYELRSNIAVLVDATGSMSATNKWENVETVYQTLFAAVRKFNKKARLLAYNEMRGKCLLTEIYLNDRFYNVLPHGQTASGEAIIATACSLKATNKKPFIIHVTDGASNWGCGVGGAITYCRQKKINLLTLGIGCNAANKQKLKKEYGNLVQFIDKIDELRRLFATLLKHSKYSNGSKPG